jgi:uncharacterized protein YbjQ (UPF0145 family)
MMRVFNSMFNRLTGHCRKSTGSMDTHTPPRPGKTATRNERENRRNHTMTTKILSLALAGLFCIPGMFSVCNAAEKVVVVPLGSSSSKVSHYLTIPSAAFTIDANTTEYNRPHMYFTSGYLALDTTLSSAQAGVLLPDHAVVTEMSVYIGDTGGNCSMYFVRQALSNAQETAIANITSPAANTGEYTIVNLQIANEKIDNQNYQYHLTWECRGLATSYDHLYAVRLQYSL